MLSPSRSCLLILSLALVNCTLVKDKKMLVSKWQISGYQIKLFHGKGSFGPDYHIYRLNKNGFGSNLVFKPRTIGVNRDELMNCVIIFPSKKDKKLIFNLCENSLQTDIPRKKVPIDTSISLDIEVKKRDTISFKEVNKIYLSNDQRNAFAGNWNRETELSQLDFKLTYIIEVTESGKRKRIFYSDGMYLSEAGNIATYRMKDPNFLSRLFK